MNVYTYKQPPSSSCDAMQDVRRTLKKYIEQKVNVDVNVRALQIVEYEYFKQCMIAKVSVKTEHV